METEPERSWQLLLKVLELNPTDRLATSLCAEILERLHRDEDLEKLYTAYLNLKPGDRAFTSGLEDAKNRLRIKRSASTNLAEVRQDLDGLNTRSNAIYTDQEHLSACMVWLRRAQTHNSGRGVAALFHMDEKRWAVDYPETTGYIIPTFLSYNHLTRDSSHLNWAVDMGDWERDIQSPEGGAGEPFGSYGLRPRVFNTGQVILGWVALFRKTGHEHYLEPACKAADWIVASQDSDGKWVRNTYSGEPKAYKSRVAWALLELYEVTGTVRYRESAERAVGWILRQANPNGWFASNSLTEPGKPWTHLIGYVLVGLLEIYRLDNARVDRQQMISLMQNAAIRISEEYLERKRNNSGGGNALLPGTFDHNWKSLDNWSCITGNAQIEFFLRRLASLTSIPQLALVADMMMDDLKRLHFIDGMADPDYYGGLPGAYPVGGLYCTYLIPNWGVKFFADCLLQRLLSEEKQIVLG